MSYKLIILPGWGQDSRNWVGFINLINTQANIQAQAIDLPGFGNQPLISTDWGIPEYSDWVNQKVAETTNPGDKVILLGHSFGGRISSLIASQNPQWLSALILYGSPSLYRPRQNTRRKIVLYKLLKRIVPASVRERFYSDDLKTSRDNGMEKIFRNVVSFDQTTYLPQINVPTLLIWGEHDEAVPVQVGEEMHGLIKNSNLVIIPGLGHNAHLQNTNLFYGIVQKFIQNLA